MPDLRPVAVRSYLFFNKQNISTIMNKEKIAELRKAYDFYNALSENNNVRVVEFHLTDGRVSGIGNPEAIKKIVALCVDEAERQLHKEQFGDYPIDLQQTKEYKAAKMFENAVNDYSFDPKKFAETLPYMHRTLQQSIFRLVAAIITFMADDGYRTDERNQASHDISKKLVEILKEEYIPFI